MKLDFRNRIALFTAFAAAFTIGVVFFVVYRVVYYSAYDHLDHDIRQEKDAVLGSLRWEGDSIIINNLPEWEEKEHSQLEINPVFLQVVNSQGKWRFRSSNLQNDILLLAPNLSTDIFFNSHIGDRLIRQGQFPIRNENNTVIGHLTVGISQEESAIVLLNLRNTLWIAFPLLLVVLFLATSIAASRGIAPVKKLIKAASGISEKNITARLPLPENQDEIYHLAATINELLQRVESGLQREKQFTSDASHEIRTPLTAIRGTLEVLLRKQRDPMQYEEKIKRVIHEVDRLNGMLEQLLQLARLESGHVPVSRTPVDLPMLFRALADKWQPRLKEKNMVMRVQIPSAASINTDATMLGIVLDNLIGNAIKYSHAGGNIDINWHPEDSSLTVRDNGPGISAAQLPYLFDRFYRADDSRNADIPGSGLGLSIAKKVADLLGFRLTVSSREGEGTAFVLQF